MVNVIQGNKNKETCFGCKHLEVKDIWRGMYTASCGRTDGLITPHEWTGEAVVITGIGKFCQGKEKGIDMERLVKKVIEANESAYDREETLVAEVDGYEFNLSRDPDVDNDWYIQVNPVGESFLFDGWWNDSSDKPLAEAVREAIKGADIWQDGDSSA